MREINKENNVIRINREMTLNKIEKEKKEQVWLKENKEAIDKHNERIQKYGCFSDEHRRF